MNKTTAWGDAVARGCGKYWKSRCVSEEKRRLEGRLRKDIHGWSRESGMEWRNLDTLGEERWWTSSGQKSSEQGWPRCYILTENSPSNFTIEAETRNGKALFLTCGGGREERALGRTELRDISEFGAHWLCQSNSAVSLSRCSGKDRQMQRETARRQSSDRLKLLDPGCLFPYLYVIFYPQD